MNNSSSKIRALIQQRFSVATESTIEIEPVAGQTATGWHVIADNHHWLVRSSTVEKKQLGLSLRKEFRVLKQLVTADLAPKPLLLSAEWLVVEWQQGEILQPSQLLLSEQRKALSQLLWELHQQPLLGYSLNLQRQFLQHWQLIDPRRASPAWMRLQQTFLRMPQPKAVKIAPLHMDVHAGNLVQLSQKLRLIDWEYAANGDIALELAALFQSQQWNSEQQSQFLADYCQSAHLPQEGVVKGINAWLPWLNYLALMWYEVRWQQTKDSSYLAGSWIHRHYLGLN